jgi:hypothetical protein
VAASSSRAALAPPSRVILRGVHYCIDQGVENILIRCWDSDRALVRKYSPARPRQVKVVGRTGGQAQKLCKSVDLLEQGLMPVRSRVIRKAFSAAFRGGFAVQKIGGTGWISIHVGYQQLLSLGLPGPRRSRVQLLDRHMPSICCTACLAMRLSRLPSMSI